MNRLRLVLENRRLAAHCEALLSALHLARDDTEKARMDLRRVAHERDEALSSGVELRCEVIGWERLTRILMEAAPADARELDV